MRDLHGRRGAANLRILSMLGQERRPVGVDMVGDVRHHIARAHCIDANPMLDGFQGQRTRQLGQCSLRGGIGGDRREGLAFASLRCSLSDFPLA